MKKINILPFIFSVILSLSAYGQSAGDYASNKLRFWKIFGEYKTSLDQNRHKSADPSGMFFIDENNNFAVSQSNGVIPSPGSAVSHVFDSPWKNFTPDAVSAYTFAQSTTTYASIVGGPGTVLITTNCDDGAFFNIPIGFSFTYDAVAYTVCAVTCNGWIAMGNPPVVFTSYVPISDVQNFNLISAFGADLYALSVGNGIYYQTSGTAPNRVFTVEYKQYGFYSAGSNEINFQIKLFETSNNIRIVYQPTTPVTSRDVQVGLKGATTLDFNNRTTATNWSATTAGGANTAACTFSATIYPANGLTFTWSPPTSLAAMYYNYNTSGGANSFPFNISTGKEVQWLVGPSEFTQPSPAPSGYNITTVWFYMAGNGSATFTNLTIKLGQTALTSLPPGMIYSGPLSTVYFRSSIALSSTLNTWMSITLDNSFPYNPSQSLVVDVIQCGYTGSGGMTVNQTNLTGVRRNYITPSGSCVMAYSGQDASVANCGITLGSPPPPPQPPVLSSPANNSVGQPVSPTLRWFSSATAFNYRVQLASDSLFSNLIVNDSTVTDTSRAVSGLSPLTYYWWRVAARNGGGYSGYSSVWKFRTFGVPTQVSLLSPSNGAINQPISLTFVWNRASDQTLPVSPEKNFIVSNYWWERVRDTVTFNDLLRDSTLTDTTKSVAGMSYLTLYFWRVKAKNQAGWGAFSVWFRFTTMNAPPAGLTLNVIPGGFYNAGLQRLNMRDTLRVLLIDTTCTRRDSARVVLDSVTFSANVSFSNAPTGLYYIYVYHRNHITVSSRLRQSIIRGSTVSYNFTADSSSAFGNNMIRVSSSPLRYGMIPGDANRDEYVDGLDQTIWINQNGLDGYQPADFNGDFFVDGLDQTIWILNNGASSNLPCFFLTRKHAEKGIRISR